MSHASNSANPSITTPRETVRLAREGRHLHCVVQEDEDRPVRTSAPSPLLVSQPAPKDAATPGG